MTFGRHCQLQIQKWGRGMLRPYIFFGRAEKFCILKFEILFVPLRFGKISKHFRILGLFLVLTAGRRGM
jgi:hypothetical protein